MTRTTTPRTRPAAASDRVARPARRGFTLVEVLMAAFIISLGTLGLLALFAGAARQQQVASEITRSVISSKNAEAIIKRSFGKLEGSGVASLAIGNWLRVPARAGDGVLSIDPSGGGKLYFLLDEPVPTIVYEVDADSEVAAGGKGEKFELVVLGDFRNLPQRRIDPATITTIDVTTNDTTSAANPVGEQVISYRYVPETASPPPPANEWPQGVAYNPNDNFAVFTSAAAADIADDYIVLDIQATPVNPQGGQLFNYPSIFQMRIRSVEDSDADSRYLKRITVGPHQYRSSDVISVADRVQRVPDDRFDSGFRADHAYALLYRRTASGSAQLAAFTYFLSGGRPGDEFIPIEGTPLFNPSAPLQRIDVTLGYDDDVERHYFEVSDDLAWAVAPGQILLVDDGPVLGGDDLPGADVPVRVIRSIRRNGVRRGEIDGVPRAASRAMLEDRSSTINLTAWVVEDVVESADGSRWRASPQEVRIFQVQ